MRVRNTCHIALLVLLALSCGACATSARTWHAPPALADCGGLFTALDRGVADARVTDAQAARIAGFPYLRADRFLASFARDNLEGAAFTAWVERLHALDVRARNIEIMNLPPAARAALEKEVRVNTDLAETVAECGARMKRHDLARPAFAAGLRAAARVPDDYRTAWRAAGLYPLTALPVRVAIADWHQRTRALFATPRDALPVQGRLVRYAPAEADAILSNTEVAALLREASRNPLGIPEPDPGQSARLLAAFAPVWEIDTQTGDDRPGRPRWTDGGIPEVDTSQPAVYTFLSHTRLGAQHLLQLNYVTWFPARPRRGAFDILGGRFDGLIWRVTLGADGRPLLYDTIHNCGCYHLFFPTPFSPPPSVARSARIIYLEPPLVLPAAPPLEAGQRLHVRLSSGAHYVQDVYAATPAGGAISHTFLDYEDLRSLPGDGTRRSLFDARGLVPGTGRGERWILWPMGIPSPGAMRQRGHHATAFVGKRHFDDAYLLEQIFTADPLPPRSASQ